MSEIDYIIRFYAEVVDFWSKFDRELSWRESRYLKEVLGVEKGDKGPTP